MSSAITGPFPAPEESGAPAQGRDNPAPPPGGATSTGTATSTGDPASLDAAPLTPGRESSGGTEVPGGIRIPGGIRVAGASDAEAAARAAHPPAVGPQGLEPQVVAPTFGAPTREGAADPPGGSQPAAGPLSTLASAKAVPAETALAKNTQTTAATAKAAPPADAPAKGGAAPAAPQRHPGAQRLPDAERSRPQRGGHGLEPRDEVPVRLSVRDRSRIPLPGSWRIAVTSLFPYSGTTTLAGVMGLTLTGMRAQPVLAVDLWPGEADADESALPADPASPADENEPRGDPLTSRVGSTGTTTVTDVIRHHADEGSSSELRLMIGGQRSGSARDLDVLPMRRDAGHLAREQAAGAASADLPVIHGADEPTVTASGLRSALGLLAHSYPLVLVDAPTDAPLTDAAVAAADLVVLVTLATAADLEATVMRLRAFRESAGNRPPGTATTPIVAAIVAPRRGRPSPRTRAGAARLGRQVDALVRIPYDPRLDPSRHTPIRIPRLRRRTRRAYLRLAAATIENLFILAKAEVETTKVASGPSGTSSLATTEAITVRAQADPTSGLPATTADHKAPMGVSFGDLRSPTAPSRIAGPDRPGGDLPARKEPR
ncbi:hypothetical protein [Frankia sp. AiPa1]|uniref:hypothetical protein n=1 Tax=Frankia sp. AiPa1 TaxID=573492 RepID=UPI00202AC70B|nr:hypothetical protein [Frankia sp. AiPa1]MCL9760740.1 hypothetical protein [Frankia sp. AiPa1]